MNKRIKIGFAAGLAVVYEPFWAKNRKVESTHPLKYGQLVYFLAEIPNAVGHCIVTTDEGRVITNLHTADFREAVDSEL